MSTTARDQPRVLLLSVVICPFGMMCTTPSMSRNVTVRRVRCSTIPVLPAASIVVAHHELILQQDEESGEIILDQALRAERDREADDRGTAQQRRDVDELIEREQHDGHDEHAAAGAPHQLRDGLGPLFPEGDRRAVVLVGERHDPARQQLDQLPPDPGQQPDAEQLERHLSQHGGGEVERGEDAIHYGLEVERHRCEEETAWQQLVGVRWERQPDAARRAGGRPRTAPSR